MTTQRIGRFFVNSEFFRRLGGNEGTNLFHRMVVLRTEDDLARDRVQYQAIHPDFRDVRRGEWIPEYQAVFTPDSPYPQWQEVKQ